MRLLRTIDAILLGERISPRVALGAVTLSGLFYGAVMGTFGGFAGDRPLQILYSAIKVPILIEVTSLLALPSFFVLYTLSGLRDDFGEAIKAVLGTQAAVGVILASLAPLTVVWYLGTGSYNEAVLFNAIIFGLASFAGQRVLMRRYAPLIARHPRHRTMVRLWIGLYAFVGIQMGWVLRPFVGQPGVPVGFLRESAWGNAYVVVIEMLLEAVRFRR